MAKKKKEESSGKFGSFLIILLFLLIWVSVLALLVKLDVGGLGTYEELPKGFEGISYKNTILTKLRTQIAWNRLHQRTFQFQYQRRPL